MDHGAVLLETLTQIGQSEIPDPLERSCNALRAVVKYIDGNLPLSSRGLTSPLHALINALSDTLKGGQPNMLRPRRRGKGAPKDLSFSSAQGVLAGLLEILIRVGVPGDAAARSIETQAASLRILDRSGQRITAKNIVTWRARANDDLASAGTRAFKKVVSLDIANQEDAESYVRGALQALANRGHGRDRNSD
jgi:hypothetical protein